MRLIVGLGNPGPDYERTRHNAGFWLVEELARRARASFRHETKLHGELARVRIAGAQVWLQKPMNFMNHSGTALAAATNFYKIPPTEVLVVHDDIDLPVGTLRLKFGGGHSGHNGLRDVIEKFGAAFWRLRIGVDHPGAKDEVVDFVLTRAGAAEQRELDEAVAAAADIIPVLMEHGAEKAMNQLHVRKARD